jgi:hypothetical protein
MSYTERVLPSAAAAAGTSTEALSAALESIGDPAALSMAGVPQIPSVALSVEDAFMLKRMDDRHRAAPSAVAEVRLRLTMVLS